MVFCQMDPQEQTSVNQKCNLFSRQCIWKCLQQMWTIVFGVDVGGWVGKLQPKTIIIIKVTSHEGHAVSITSDSTVSSTYGTETLRQRPLLALAAHCNVLLLFCEPLKKWLNLERLVDQNGRAHIVAADDVLFFFQSTFYVPTMDLTYVYL